MKKNEEQAKQLRHDIEHLWSRLDIEEDQRQAFNEVTHGCKPSILTAVRDSYSSFVPIVIVISSLVMLVIIKIASIFFYNIL